MDGQQFDQLARAYASGATRRNVLKGLAGGAVGGLFAGVQTQDVGAQCSWSGTFTSSLGGITMTLTEAAGQVNGTYSFTDNNAVTTGTISGTVRTEYPGYTVLDGYWREPGEGGRVWLTMPLDACAQFAGSYTGTDTSDAWTPGWDGVRSSGESGGTGGSAEPTFFTNPGDSRVAAYTAVGQAVTLFGPKDGDGSVQYINQAQVDSADGDPQKRVWLDFDATGAPTRATLANGEMMAFEWVGPTKVIITYRSADGSQEAQVPFDASEATAAAVAPSVLGRTMRAQEDVIHLLAFSGVPDPAGSPGKSPAALPLAQEFVPLARGVIEVRCQSGALIDEVVFGHFRPVNTPNELVPLSFMPTAQAGVYSYTLPLVGAPPADEQAQATWVSRFRGSLGLICGGTTVSLLVGLTSSAAICAKLGLATGPAGVTSCGIFMICFRAMCGLNTATTVAKWVSNSYNSIEVTAQAHDPKGGIREITVKATAGYEVPKGVITLPGAAGISDILTDPVDPVPQNGYTVTIHTTCVGAQTQLTLTVVGTDGYAPPPTIVPLSQTVTEGSLSVPGAAQGVQDTITAQLSGAVSDTKTKTIVF